MRAGPLALALALVFLALPVAQARPGGAVEAAVQFHEARQGRPCSEVWAWYSRDTQAQMRASSRRLAEESGRPEDERPEESHCRRLGKVKPGTARLVRQVGAEAVV